MYTVLGKWKSSVRCSKISSSVCILHAIFILLVFSACIHPSVCVTVIAVTKKERETNEIIL